MTACNGRLSARWVASYPPKPTIDGVAFTGEGKLIRKATGYEQEKLKPRYPTAEIDLDTASAGPESDLQPQWIVLADDFVGSRRTISRLVSVSAAPLIQVVRRFQQAQIRILIVAGFEVALKKLLTALVPFNDRLQLSVVMLLRNEDRCFSPDSKIFPDPSDRERLRQFCVQAAKASYPRLPKDMRLL